MKIDVLKKTVDIVLNKNHKGVITASRLNNLAEQAVYQVFSELVDIYRNSNTKRKTNIDGYSYSQVEDTLQIFKTRAGISGTNGVFDLPSDYEFSEKNAIICNNRPVEIVKPDQQALLSLSYLNIIDEYNLIAMMLDGKVEIIPDDVVRYIKLYYYRKPVSPQWAYEELPSGVLAFQSAQSTDIELPYMYLPRITRLVLSDLGVHIREPQITQLMEQENNTDYSKNVQ